jgi:FixJ family two-component response regulator
MAGGFGFKIEPKVGQRFISLYSKHKLSWRRLLEENPMNGVTSEHSVGRSASEHDNVERATIHIVDDDVSFRRAIARLLQASGYQVRAYESAIKLLDRLPEPTRGCILLDVQMPGLNGPQLQEVLDRLGFELPIVFLTGHGDIPASVRAIKAGAEDFLAKPTPKKVLLETIERALRRYDGSHQRNVWLKALRQRFSALSPREHEVFSLVVQGRLNKQIAHELGTSERTIKAHRHSIMEKFKAKSLAELVAFAEALGVLETLPRG